MANHKGSEFTKTEIKKVVRAYRRFYREFEESQGEPPCVHFEFREMNNEVSHCEIHFETLDWVQNYYSNGGVWHYADMTTDELAKRIKTIMRGGIPVE